MRTFQIVDTTTGEELPTGKAGEIMVRGPTVMLGYLNRPDATAESIERDGWLHTGSIILFEHLGLGDIGYVDEAGYLFIVDRLKELIKVKGLQVSKHYKDGGLIVRFHRPSSRIFS